MLEDSQKNSETQNSPTESTPSLNTSTGTKHPVDDIPATSKPFKLPLAKQPTSKWPIVGGILALIVLVAVGIFIYMMIQPSAKQAAVVVVTPSPSPSPKVSQYGPELDISKDYGNKYADGLLPVGDNHYQTTGAKEGYIYACSGYATNLTSTQAGANARGPWFTNNNTEYDVNKKAHVSGDVKWQGSFTNVVNGSTRTITSNDLPLTDGTGIFPIQSTDMAYTYDKNPNSIKAQSLTYALSASPHYGSPQCMGGTVGVMLTGVALFNAFDASGRDAGAWEVQDNCGGHPEREGMYHYHTLSSCITDTNVQTVIGFALDGFPITGPKVTATSILTTSDLDECHGTTSDVILDGKKVNTYHYVMTQDFPYSVSCFRATAITPPAQQQAPPTQ